MQSFSRRSFLRGIGLLVLSAGFSSSAHAKKKEKNRKVRTISGTLLIPSLAKSGEGSVFTICHLEKAQVYELEVPLNLGHSVIVNPVRPEQAVIIEQSGRRACFVDISKRIVGKIIELKEGSVFYGHGAYSPDGKTVYLTEEIAETEKHERGVLSQFDAESGTRLGEIPTFGKYPHQVAFVNNGKTIVVANEGERIGAEPRELNSSLVFINVKNHKLIKSYPVQGKNIFASHLVATEDGKVALATRSMIPAKNVDPKLMELLKNPVEFKRNWTKFVEFVQSPVIFADLENWRQTSEVETIFPRMLHNLSIAFNKTGTQVMVTHSAVPLLSVWNFFDAKLIKTFEFSDNGPPAGVCLSSDGSYFAVTRYSGKITLIDSDTLEIVPSSFLENLTVSVGSHMTLIREI